MTALLSTGRSTEQRRLPCTRHQSSSPQWTGSEFVAIDRVNGELAVIFDAARVTRRYASKAANRIVRWATEWIWKLAEGEAEGVAIKY
jgi:hypothetical protein